MHTLNDTARLVIKGLDSSYEVEHLARVFYPEAQIAQGPSTRGRVLYARVSRRWLVTALRLGGGCVLRRKARQSSGEESKLELCRMLYEMILEQGRPKPPWGMLTGVRPVHLLRKAQHTGGRQAGRDRLQGVYDISEEKLCLLEGIVERQQKILNTSGANSYSLYVSIPFCPTRCSYCSFVSRSIEKEAGSLEPYLELLLQELDAIKQLAQELRLRLETVYVGGGTPTTLSAGQLDRLLGHLNRQFGASSLAEFTVEAGRPDSTDREKLRVMKQQGVSRLSINPQTMQNHVLKAIGRNHTAEDILRCYEEARKQGHSNINMDLIAGLPQDTQAGFENTLRQVLALHPENITLHTLTLKRASNLVIEKSKESSHPGTMVDTAYACFEQGGYQPYYLYRQKSTVENLENTGWCLPGREGLYNVFIMEEAHTILAAGAGGSTKLVHPETGKIERIFNYKYPAEYLRDFSQLLDKKRGVKEFYAGNLDPEAPG